MYSQIILKQFVWGPYNRCGPYNGCFSESMAGSCLSGSSHWHSFPVGNCLCRHWVTLQLLGGYWQGRAGYRVEVSEESRSPSTSVNEPGWQVLCWQHLGAGAQLSLPTLQSREVGKAGV